MLDHVLPLYKYASIAELNAILERYNIIADKGGKDSRIYSNRGLVYRILDADKKKIGVSIAEKEDNWFDVSGKIIFRRI